MSQLSEMKVHVKLRLVTLWAATMFCYVYCDYFELYVPGKLDSMLQGRMGPLGQVTQQVLLGTSVLMIVPSLMVFLSLALPARHSRWLNIVVGLLYTALLVMLALTAPWFFYKLFAGIEAVLTALVVWYAWTWPRETAAVG
jgi:phosphoglycerol transferase MdoB-like AlkP superfamily enzyme